MPSYVYEVIAEDGSGGERFEVVQAISEPPLTEHPETRAPVRRVPQAPNLPLKHGDAATRDALSDGNLDRLGFTKYERAGGGRYEKRAGRGPDSISAD